MSLCRYSYVLSIASTCSAIAVALRPPAATKDKRTSLEHSAMALQVLSEFTGTLRGMLRDSAGDVRAASATAVKEVVTFLLKLYSVSTS